MLTLKESKWFRVPALTAANEILIQSTYKDFICQEEEKAFANVNKRKAENNGK